MTQISLKIIELEQDNYHILVEGSFEDNTPCYWIIDTGASKTVLDINLKDYYQILNVNNTDDYQSAGISQGMLETSVGEMRYLRINDLEIKNIKVALIDLNHVNGIYGKYANHPIAGLLGGDILMYYKCRIDYDSRTIQFTVPQTAQ